MFLVVSSLTGRKFVTSSSNIDSAIFNARQRRQNTSIAVAIENERLSSKYNRANCMISMHFKFIWIKGGENLSLFNLKFKHEKCLCTKSIKLHECKTLLMCLNSYLGTYLVSIRF